MSTLSPAVPPSWFLDCLSTPCRSAFFNINAKKYHYLEWGDNNKPSIVFLHGALANAYWFMPIAPLLSKDFFVRSLSLAGHGRSDWHDSYQLETLLDVVEYSLDLNSPGGNYLIGHSLGARIALLYAQTRQHRLKGLCLLDPPFGPRIGLPRRNTTKYHFPVTRKHRYASDEQTLIDRFCVLPAQPKHNPFLYDYIARNSIHSDSQGYRWQFDPNFFNKIKFPSAALTSTIQPTCQLSLIAGKNSQITTAEVIAGYQKLFAQLQCFSLDQSWHALMLDQPQDLAKLVQQICY